MRALRSGDTHAELFAATLLGPVLKLLLDVAMGVKWYEKRVKKLRRAWSGKKKAGKP